MILCRGQAARKGSPAQRAAGPAEQSLIHAMPLRLGRRTEREVAEAWLALCPLAVRFWGLLVCFAASQGVVRFCARSAQPRSAWRRRMAAVPGLGAPWGQLAMQVRLTLRVATRPRERRRRGMPWRRHPARAHLPALHSAEALPTCSCTPGPWRRRRLQPGLEGALLPASPAARARACARGPAYGRLQ
jgi:hypothetical protein